MPGIVKVKPERNPYYGGKVGLATFTVGAYASNVALINVQLKDAASKNPTQRVSVKWYISTDSAGGNLAAATSGAIAAGARGVVVNEVTKQAGFAVSDATGGLDFSITDTTVRSIYLVIVLPDGALLVSPILTHP